MKKLVLFSILICCGICFSYAQKVKVSLNDNAYMIKGDKYAALEINGKIVIPDTKYYTDFTFKGKHFIAEFIDGSFMLLDREGNKVKVGGVFVFSKLSIVDGTIIAQISKDGEARYYSEDNPSVELKVQKAGHDFFDKDRKFNPEKMAQAKATLQADSLSKLVRADGKFEIRPKPDSYRQQIFLKGKMMHEAQEYNVISGVEDWNKTGCWMLIAKNNGLYGVVAVEIWEEDGKKGMQVLQTVPYEYTFALHHNGNMVKCTTRSVTSHWLNWWGWKFDNDWRTGKFTPTNMKWILDKSTNKWALQKQEEKK